MHMDVKGRISFSSFFVFTTFISFVRSVCFHSVSFLFCVQYECFYLQLKELFSKCYFGISLCINQLWWHWLRFRFFYGCCPGSTWNSISQQCESKAIHFQNKMMKELCDLTQYFILLLIDINCYETMWNQYTYSSKWIKIMKQISKNIESQCKLSVISECEW